MAERFCPNCGTEVDADARFCPTCGQPLEGPNGAEGEELEAGAGDEQAIPAAPAWSSSTPAEPQAPEVETPGLEAPGLPADGPAPQRDVPPPVPPSGPPPPPVAPAAPPAPVGGGGEELPITIPVTVAGWLVGAGSGLGALALLPRLGNVLNLFLFVGLLGVTATVFLADRLPPFSHTRLATLSVVLVALGVALDRSAFTVRGIDTLFLICVLAATAGVLLVELDRDRPLPPPDDRA